jgi:hypothetical protein
MLAAGSGEGTVPGPTGPVVSAVRAAPAPAALPGITGTNADVEAACPCDGPFASHDQYVNCATAAANELHQRGLVTNAERKSIITSATDSTCGNVNNCTGVGALTVVGALTTPRHSHTSTVLNSSGLVLAAGGVGTAGVPMASAELYDPLFATWAPLASGGLAVARARHTATKLSDGSILFVGGNRSAASWAASTSARPDRQHPRAGGRARGGLRTGGHLRDRGRPRQRRGGRGGLPVSAGRPVPPRPALTLALRVALPLALSVSALGCAHVDGTFTSTGTPLGSWTFSLTHCYASRIPYQLNLSSSADPLRRVSISADRTYSGEMELDCPAPDEGRHFISKLSFVCAADY